MLHFLIIILICVKPGYSKGIYLKDNNDSTDAKQTANIDQLILPTTAFNKVNSESGGVCSLAKEIGTVCASEKHEIDNFVYSCFNTKKFEAKSIKSITNEFSLCCRACDVKNRKENKACLHNFCDCIDMLNLLHGQRLDECTSQYLKPCYKEPTQYATDDDFKKDVGFVQVVKKNLILGKGGMAFYFIYVIISILATIYLTIVCVKYRCLKNQMMENLVLSEMNAGTEANDTTVTAIQTDAVQTDQSTNTTPFQSNSVSQTSITDKSIKGTSSTTTGKDAEPTSISTTKSQMDINTTKSLA